MRSYEITIFENTTIFKHTWLPAQLSPKLRPPPWLFRCNPLHIWLSHESCQTSARSLAWCQWCGASAQKKCRNSWFHHEHSGILWDMNGITGYTGTAHNDFWKFGSENAGIWWQMHLHSCEIIGKMMSFSGCRTLTLHQSHQCRAMEQLRYTA